MMAFIIVAQGVEEESPRRVGGGGGTSHISTLESLDEGVVRQRLELPTSLREGGGVVQQWLELPTSWCEGEGAAWLHKL
jgi:hypothetical protein